MITIIVIDEPKITDYSVEWQEGMNGLEAMKALHASDKEFTYALAGDNFITMINEKYESSDPLASPYYYWEILYNGIYSNIGIHDILLEEGDNLTFEYTIYDPDHHPESLIHIRYNMLKNLQS